MAFSCPSFHPCAFRFSAVQVYRLPLAIFLEFSSFFRCALPVGVFSLIFRFFWFLGTLGEVMGGFFFSFGAVFSAEAGTFDFERQYSVLGVFSRFGGFEKPRKSYKKVLGIVLFFGAAENEVRNRFQDFRGPVWSPFSSPGLKKKELDRVLFSET